MEALLHAGRSSSSSLLLRRKSSEMLAIHAAGDKWADRGGSALPQGGWASRPPAFKTPGRAGTLPLLFSHAGRAPRRIRQSRSCHRREQSFAHSGVRSVAPGLYRSLPFRRFPRRWNPTFLFSVQNLHLTFASVRVIRGSISSSRRWRQVGGPRRVGPTVFKVGRATPDMALSP